MNLPARQPGVVLRVDGALRFIPAHVAVRVAWAPPITTVPGAPAELIGVALQAGAIVPVVAVGPERAEMIVCLHAGELIGIIGGRVVRTGTFVVASREPDVVEHEGELAHTLDVGAIYARVQTGTRAGRRS